MKPIIPFNKNHRVEYGMLERLSPTLRRLTAPNPGVYTFHGTGTFVVGHGNVAVIDPGPAIESHIATLLDALKGETITHILVTHTHQDHSPACALLQQRIDAPSYGFGPHGGGILVNGIAPDEGGDLNFRPDITVSDGEVIAGASWELECVHTPGHTSNHLCFAHSAENSLLSGDHVMGWSTSVISPPDGNMGDYMRSLQRVLGRKEDTYWPAHGGPIRQPRSLVMAFVRHREWREQQVLECISSGLQTIAQLVPSMYDKLDPALYPAAARSVFATVIHLYEKGLLDVDGELTIDASIREV